MAVVNVEYAGGAVQTTVSGSLTPTVPGAGATFTVADATGYPAAGRFAVKLNAGLSDEEHVLIASRSGTTFTVDTRGYDGTTAQNHTNPTCELYFDAVSANKLVDHVDGGEADPHSTTLLNNTRHDVTARHQFGGALGTPGTPTALTADIAGAAGVGTVPARSDHAHSIATGTPVAIGTALAESATSDFARAGHVHTIGAGAINNTNMFGSQVVPAAALVNDSVTATQLAANAVGASELATGAVAATADLVDGILTLAKFSSEAAATYTPTLGGEVGASNTKLGWYYKLGRLVFVIVDITLGSGGNIVGNITISLPPGIANNGTIRGFGALRAREAGASTWGGVGQIATGGTSMTTIGTAGANQWETNTPFNWTDGDNIVGVMVYFADS